jgi:hypothetical protein
LFSRTAKFLEFANKSLKATQIDCILFSRATKTLWLSLGSAAQLKFLAKKQLQLTELAQIVLIAEGSLSLKGRYRWVAQNDFRGDRKIRTGF